MAKTQHKTIKSNKVNRPKIQRKYDAVIKFGNVINTITVDMQALPYGRFDSEHPLVIVPAKKADGKRIVCMGKYDSSLKIRDLPDFTNVIISYAFDCSRFTINKSSVLPRGIKELICLQSINSLSDLPDDLPQTLKKIVVSPYILKQVKNKDDNLTYAKEFMAKYPDIDVTDGAQSLFDIVKLAETSRVAAPVVKQPQSTVHDVQNRLTEKTNELLSNKEVVELCKQDSYIASNMEGKEIERYVRIAKGDSSGLNLQIVDVANPNDKNSNMRCIYAADAQRVVDFVRETHQDFKRTHKLSDDATKNTVDTQPKTDVAASSEQSVSPNKLYVGDKEIEKIKIEKYIPENIIEHLSDADQLKMLREIDKINVKPFYTKKQDVYYVDENGAVGLSSNVKRKRSRVLSQGISSSDNRRIVWYVDENVFYAAYFFAQHDKTPQYNLVIKANNTAIDKEIDYIKALVANAKEKGVDLSIEGWKQRLNIDAKTEKIQTDDKDNGGVASVDVPTPVVTDTPVAVPRKRGRPKGSKNKKNMAAKTDAPEQSVETKVAQPVTKDVVESVNESKVDQPVTKDVKSGTFVVKHTIPPVDAQVPTWGDNMYPGFAEKLYCAYCETAKQVAYLEEQIVYCEDTNKKLEYSRQLCECLLKQQQLEEAILKLESLQNQFQQLKDSVKKLM